MKLKVFLLFFILAKAENEINYTNVILENINDTNVQDTNLSEENDGSGEFLEPEPNSLTKLEEAIQKLEDFENQSYTNPRKSLAHGPANIVEIVGVKNEEDRDQENAKNEESFEKSENSTETSSSEESGESNSIEENDDEEEKSSSNSTRAKKEAEKTSRRIGILHIYWPYFISFLALAVLIGCICGYFIHGLDGKIGEKSVA
uniref:Uncharacterized protein n=1 Tax=Acrobeloides nanus TaxID=290746 RepID=A0A914CUU1_9BILA